VSLKDRLNEENVKTFKTSLLSFFSTYGPNKHMAIHVLNSSVKTGGDIQQCLDLDLQLEVKIKIQLFTKTLVKQ
jgi:hypothetical protein